MREIVENLNYVYLTIAITVILLLYISMLIRKHVPYILLSIPLGIGVSILLNFVFERVFIISISLNEVINNIVTLIMLSVAFIAFIACIIVMIHTIIYSIYKKIQLYFNNRNKIIIFQKLPSFIKNLIRPRRLNLLSLLAIIPSLVILAISCGLYFQDYSEYLLDSNKIYPSTYINSIDVSNLTYEETYALLEDDFRQQSNQYSIEFVYDDISVDFNSAQLGIKTDFPLSIAKAYKYVRKGNYLDRIDAILSIDESTTIELHSNITFDKIALEECAQILSDKFVKDSRDADFSFNPNNESHFIYNKEIDALILDKETAYKILLDKTSNFDFSQETLSLRKIPASVSKEDLSQKTQLIGEYTTNLSSNSNRNTNVEISGESIEGILMPGESFSFNEKTGKRSISTGYKTSKIIVASRVVSGVGGGVCQTSTTLFNALLQADVEFTEHHYHSLNVSYVPKGLDATVSFGSKDLKYINTHDTPIYITSYLDYDNLTFNVKIYGTPQYEGVVKIDYRKVDGRYKIVKDYYIDEEFLYSKIVDT